MTRCFFLSATFLALASCANAGGSDGTMTDDPTPPGDKKPPMSKTSNEIKTGTRLRSRFAAGDDGSQIAIGLYDSKLNIECQFSEAEDGKQRCLPTRTATLRVPDSFVGSYSAARGFFKDSNCTDRIATSNLCEPAARYVKFSDSCGGRPRIANAIDIAPPTTIYIRRADGMCAGLTTSGYPVLLDLRFYSMGTSVQPEEFVGGIVATD